MREVLRRVVPVIVVVAGLLAIWYAAAFIVDAPQGALALTRPLVPQPHQVIATLIAGVLQPLGPRSLIYHAAVTASSATVGFALAFVLGVALAIGIVNLRIFDRSLMPWIIASQTIPALAVAPMVVVVLGNIGLTGLIPKALIAAWLSFFPIVTAMVAGLRSPERIQLDLMRTYDAGSWDVFAQLRWPASMGFLFPGMKVAATLAVVGAIVAELPTGAVAGLGARLLGASYYGQTLQLWAALAMASILAVIAVAAVDAGRGVLVRVRGGRLLMEGRFARIAAPLAFGFGVLALWQAACMAFHIPRILLPAPTAIAAAFAANLAMLGADFVQTTVRSMLPGFAIGSAAGFAVALLIDASPFLRRGVLPVASLAGALPIVGIAPIMVMWFGFDWQSKAAVAAVMTFFPMLVNTVAGLEAPGAMERDLLRSYSASGLQTLAKLRLPAALPYIFTALKLNTTLALIGAIVAEFFGTPTVGMGFRISTEAARLDLDVVWAETLVAAITGSALFFGLAYLERNVTFWRPAFQPSTQKEMD